MKSDEMYREHILENYRNPSNFGRLEEFDFYCRKVNSFCGDVVEVYLIVGKDDLVEDIKFSGGGCAISVASSSLLTEFVKGKSLEEVKKLKGEDVLKILEIPISSGRMKCALLCFEALKEGLGGDK